MNQRKLDKLIKLCQAPDSIQALFFQTIALIEPPEDFHSKVEDHIRSLKTLHGSDSKHVIWMAWLYQKLNQEVRRALKIEEKVSRHIDALLDFSGQTEGALIRVLLELPDRQIIANQIRIELKEKEPEVIVDDPEKLPEGMVFEEVEKSRCPIWNKIRRKIRSGEAVPGARLEPKYRLVVR